MRASAEHIARLERAVLIVARVVERDTAALPVFDRLDRELTSTLAVASAARTRDPIAHARALLKAQEATRAMAAS